MAVAGLAQRLERIPATAQFRLLPVRHHSPACAFHLQSIIRRDRPEVILIEGPADATPLIRYLGEKDARPPLAIYCYCVAPAPALASTGLDAESSTRIHYRSFYPLAAFSPEWVAIREGLAIGAEIIFIDQPFASRLNEDRVRTTDRGRAETTLFDEHRLAGADRVQALVKRSRCRDFNEWWDRYFESGAMATTAENYFSQLLSWCLLLREGHPQADDPETVQREQYMAARIRQFRTTARRCLVVTGGYHTESLAYYCNQTDAPVAVAPEPGNYYLIPYTLSRLDSANQYAAGMTDIAYYHTVWQQLRTNKARAHAKAGETIAIKTARVLQQRGEIISLPDCIEAVMMSRRLAALRGVPPGRAEILDAMQAAFIKDGREPDSVSLSIDKLLSKELIGRVPKSYPAAPLVEDFRRCCREFKLTLGGVETQEKHLDIYRSGRQRQISRLLHQLRFLGVDYAQLNAGPDFVAGSELARVREIWSLRWSPQVDTRLTERMAYGSFLPEACLNRLLEQLHDGRQAIPELLIEALRMGLHGVLQKLLDGVGQWLDQQHEFSTLVAGLVKLNLAYRAQNALAARQLPGLEPLLGLCFERACLRLSWLGQMDEQSALAVRTALGDLNSLARSENNWADVDLFLRCVQALFDSRSLASIAGKAAGILTVRRVWDHRQSAEVITASCLQAYTDATYLGNFLTGFLPVARSFLIHSPALLQAMGEAIMEWDEATFLTALPGLRLAFTVLRPRETATLAGVLAELTGSSPLLIDKRWSADDLTSLATMYGQSRETLSRWGFDGGDR